MWQLLLWIEVVCLEQGTAVAARGGGEKDLQRRSSSRPERRINLFRNTCIPEGREGAEHLHFAEFSKTRTRQGYMSQGPLGTRKPLRGPSSSPFREQVVEHPRSDLCTPTQHQQKANSPKCSSTRGEARQLVPIGLVEAPWACVADNSLRNACLQRQECQGSPRSWPALHQGEPGLA